MHTPLLLNSFVSLLLYVVHHVVHDAVVDDVDPVRPRLPRRLLVRAHVETHDEGVADAGDGHVALRDGPHPRRQNLALRTEVIVLRDHLAAAGAMGCGTNRVGWVGG